MIDKKYIYIGGAALAVLAYFLWQRNTAAGTLIDTSEQAANSYGVLSGYTPNMVIQSGQGTPLGGEAPGQMSSGAGAAQSIAEAIQAALANISANASMHYSDNATMLYMQLAEELARQGGGRVQGTFSAGGQDYSIWFGVDVPNWTNPATPARPLNPLPTYSSGFPVFNAGAPIAGPDGSGGGGGSGPSADGSQGGYGGSDSGADTSADTGPSPGDPTGGQGPGGLGGDPGSSSDLGSGGGGEGGGSSGGEGGGSSGGDGSGDSGSAAP
jgi:hypothetical protein